MVKKEKASFFGKIMGGSVTDDVVEETMPVITEPDAEELSDVDVADEEEMVMVEDESQEEESAPQPVQKKETNEEWMSDFEGQLNIDMYQTRDNVIIKSTIAGVRPEDIDITIANDMVTIKGSRKKDEVISQDDYFYQECYWGNFSRSVIVPVDIESENIEADLKDGILTVIVPKAAKAKVKKVKVKGL
jgi:HSP20 family protein